MISDCMLQLPHKLGRVGAGCDVTRDLEITDLKSFPSEVVELASMSIELISLEHWDVF